MWLNVASSFYDSISALVVLREISSYVILTSFCLCPNYLISISLSFSLSVSSRWWKCMACQLWGCLFGTSWSFQFSSCVSGYCCSLCRSTPTLAPETSLPQGRGSFSSFLPGKTIALVRLCGISQIVYHRLFRVCFCIYCLIYCILCSMSPEQNTSINITY